MYNLGSEIPTLETHDQNVFRDRCASASLDTEAQLENAPCQRGEERAGEKFPACLGQGATKEQRQGKSQKMRCAQHIPCWGKIGPEGERKQMRGPSSETRGNSRHSRESRLENMKQQGLREISSVWLCAKIQGGREEGELCPEGMRSGPKPNAKELLSVYLSTKGHLIG